MHLFGLLYFGSLVAFYFVVARVLRAHFPQVERALALDLLLIYAASMTLGAQLVSAGIHEAGGLKGGSAIFLILLAVRAAWKREHRGALVDTAAVALPASLTLAKLGCWFSGCCYGTETLSSWAVHERGEALPGRHPTQLYEAAILVFAMVSASIALRRRSGTGQPILVMVLVMSVGRFATEFVRGDVKPFAGTQLTGAQWITLAGALAATFLLAWAPARRACAEACREERATDTPEVSPGGVLYALIVSVTSLFAVAILGFVGLLRLWRPSPPGSPWPAPERLWRWMALGLIMMASATVRALVTEAPAEVMLPMVGVTMGGWAVLAVLLVVRPAPSLAPAHAAIGLDDEEPLREETADAIPREPRRRIRRRR